MLVDKNKNLLIILALVALSILALVFARVTFSEATIEYGGSVQKVDLPVALPAEPNGGVYNLEFRLYKSLLATGVVTIIPDDNILGIMVNDQSVDLSGISADSLRDFTQGVTIDLSAHLRSGENHLQIRFADQGGAGHLGMKIQPGLYSLGALLAGLFFLLALYFIGREANLMYRISPLHFAIYVLILFGLLFRVAIIVTYNPLEHIWSDPERHWLNGIELFRIDLMSAADPILYQLYIANLAKLTIKAPLLVAFYTSILSVLTPWIWYRFARECGIAKTSALLVFAALTWLPSWVSIYSYFMQETLLLPLLGLALWATWRARRKNTLASFLIMIFCWLLASLTRGIVIPLAAVCCTWLWVAQDQKFKKCFCSLLLLGFILWPLTYRSMLTVNHMAPHGMGYLAAIYGISGKREIVIHSKRDGERWTSWFGSPSTSAQPFSPFSDWTTQRTGVQTIDIDLKKGRADWQAALESARSNFPNHFWIYKENLIFLFFGPPWPDANKDRLLDEINVAMRWLWAPLFIVVLGLVWRSRKNLDYLYFSLIVTWFVVQGLLPIAVNEGRYRKPFEGMLIVQLALLMGRTRNQKPETRNQKPVTSS